MNLKNKINKFFNGCYGYDELNKFLLVLYTIILIINLFIRTYILYILGIIILIVWIFRVFSKEREKRYSENVKFMKITAPIRIWFINIKNHSKSNYKLFICHNCNQKVRVPKGKGKIQITCPKCGRKFIKRS